MWGANLRSKVRIVSTALCKLIKISKEMIGYGLTSFLRMGKRERVPLQVHDRHFALNNLNPRSHFHCTQRCAVERRVDNTRERWGWWWWNRCHIWYVLDPLVGLGGEADHLNAGISPGRLVVETNSLESILCNGGRGELGICSDAYG